jgi:PTH1 family peptidyl-tRNA hydrolase
MKIIVGLGNPGSKYKKSRHNLGFLVVKELAKRYNITMRKKISKALLGEGTILGEGVLLVLPLTYMNSSGQAVGPLVEKRKINPKDMLVVCDDVNLKLGAIRMRPYGSAGGHKGLKSIIDALNSKSFPRLRVGISGPVKIKDLAGFVLAPFAKEQMKIIKEVVIKSMEAIEVWLKSSIEIAMNRFNRPAADIAKMPILRCRSQCRN